MLRPPARISAPRGLAVPDSSMVTGSPPRTSSRAAIAPAGPLPITATRSDGIASASSRRDRVDGGLDRRGEVIPRELRLDRLAGCRADAPAQCLVVEEVRQAGAERTRILRGDEEARLTR